MRYVRGFGMVSAREQREADLFLRDLVGLKVARPAAARPVVAPPVVARPVMARPVAAPPVMARPAPSMPQPWQAPPPRSEAFEADHAFEYDYEQDAPAQPQPTPATPQPFLPTGGTAFAPQQGTFNCRPSTPFMVIPASFLPARTDDPGAAIDAALTAAGLSAAQRRQVPREGLEPIARAFGPNALTELFARLRWAPETIVAWSTGRTPKLVPRLLIHVPGHFRELARRTSSANDAFVLECMGWLFMAHLRDEVAGATRQRWWIPPPPTWATAVPNPIPPLDLELGRFVLRHLFVHTTMTPEQWNGRLQAWCNGLPGRQWQAELRAEQPGLPFYASLVTVPAHISTTTIRTTFDGAWTRRLNDVDAMYAPHAAGATTVTLSGLQNAAALRECAPRYIPAGAHAPLALEGLELASDLPLEEGGRTIRQVNVLAQLHPAITPLLRAIKELGWNDLVFQTSGADCFRGIKHDASATVTVDGRRVTVSPFNRPDATTVERINTLFTPAQRAAVLAAAQTARRISDHALGVAMDINVPENVQRVASRPFGSMDPRVVAIFEAFNFRWGACFRPTDPHHFEYCRSPCAPAAVAAPTEAPRGTMIPMGAGPVIV